MIAQKNAPRERQALIIANARYEQQMKAHPEWESSNDKKKKIRGQAIQDARQQVNAHKERVDISAREWEAIQAGAIAPTKLKQIFRFADSDRVKQLATPRRNNNQLSKSQLSRMKSLASKGYTNEEIAKALGVSASTVVKYLSGKE